MDLRSPGEHFDEVVVQAIVELALEAPLELGMVEVARVQFEIVGMHLHIRIFEADDDFDSLAFFPRIEGQQRVLVKAKLLENALQAGVRHQTI